MALGILRAACMVVPQEDIREERFMLIRCLREIHPRIATLSIHTFIMRIGGEMGRVGIDLV